MGTFTHPVTLHAASGNATDTLDALVDTGSTFTSIPSPILERLGVEPHRNIRPRLADGRVEEQAIGRVLADLNGESEIIVCVIADPDALSVIGAHTLEAFLPGVDRVDHRPVPVEALWTDGI